MVTRREFNRIKKENPESRIWQRKWEEQKVRNEIFNAMKSGNETKEKELKIKYISQKIKWETNEPLNQNDLLFLLSLPREGFAKLPGELWSRKKYMYLFDMFKDIKLDSNIMKELKNESKREAYLYIKEGIKKDKVFKYISINTALKYLSQHELADIMTYNTNHWTYPNWQLDILAKRFGYFTELDPLEFAKKFESQVGIRGKVYKYGDDPIEILIYSCNHLTPEFEKYLIEKWYKKELNERKKIEEGKRKETERKDDMKSEDVAVNNNEAQMKNDDKQVDLSFWELIERDKWAIEDGIQEQRKMFWWFRKLNGDSSSVY